jgi:antitoxin component YwqK of YwqJK toxin-antitoxin module
MNVMIYRNLLMVMSNTFNIRLIQFGVALLILNGCNFKKNRLENKKYIHDQNGKIVIEYDVNDKNQIHGTYLEFYNNIDKKRFEIEYKDGKKNGDFIEYFRSGKIHYHVEFRNDKLWNIKNYYSDNEKSLEFGDFKNGNGKVNIYTHGGFLEKSGNYINGLREGYWYSFNRDGSKGDSIFFKSGINNETGILEQWP